MPALGRNVGCSMSQSSTDNEHSLGSLSFIDLRSLVSERQPSALFAADTVAGAWGMQYGPTQLAL
ncbi:hypothetical protein BO94DRAFT_591007 [Aspergillus sclerotioniger CBS 115572]|uniref:Uncharacterized protein n=1 Tax=Aspergillus sclerotioniger CBS 115572 TaxID=1450535 RepID=A0A317V2N8_9EURO|nr:hypothetical protein BO94DRAFT_591007 [Aspergillus sclerotioniger CBS 115572]PWY67097.1 hypothetical protein BO94DRAFT_591007 [Aspergillus sclerotioniger CBS 115572]